LAFVECGTLKLVIRNEQRRSLYRASRLGERDVAQWHTAMQTVFMPGDQKVGGICLKLDAQSAA